MSGSGFRFCEWCVKTYVSYEFEFVQFIQRVSLQHRKFFSGEMFLEFSSRMKPSNPG